jgi:AraC family transcriptional regulator
MSLHRASTNASSAAEAAAGIGFEWDGEPVALRQLFASDGLRVHRIVAGTRTHRVRIQRSAHTMLVFDAGAYSDGIKRIDGVAARGATTLDGGVDLLPAGMELAGWSGQRCNIAATFVSVDPNRLEALLGEGHHLGLTLQANTQMLRPLAARVRTWAAHEWRGVEPMHADTLLLLMLQEFAELQRTARSAVAASQTGGLSPRAQRLLREFVAERIETKIELQAMASVVGLSRFHFARAFKASFGTSPHQFVLQERVRRAADLMRNSRVPITDIALSVGFAGSSELSRSFRQAMGCTPRDYRAGLTGAAAGMN